MKYKNERTGVEIDCPFEIKGGGWEPVEAPAQPAADAGENTETGKAKKRGRGEKGK